MSELLPAGQKAAQSVAARAAGGLLQRKCDCGNSTTAGGECAECGRKRLQRKLEVGASDDPLELEADRLADQVLASPVHSSVRAAPPRVNRAVGSQAGNASPAPASVDRVLAETGRPLEPALRHDMEKRFGCDFAHVRVHSGAAAEQSAQDVNARAYTVGHDIVFRTGRFAPQAQEGRRLLAHELTHVVQQAGVGPRTTVAATLQRDSDQALTNDRVRDLLKYVANNPSPYRHVIEIIRFSRAQELDDNVAAGFVEALPLALLEKFAATPDGREMLNVLYDAMMTGHVTRYEVLQSDKILFAKWKWSPAEALTTSQLRDPEVRTPEERAVEARASQIANDLNEKVSKKRYRDAIELVRKNTFIEDDVASRFVVLQSPDKLQNLASTPDGQTLLNVLYDALITGDVTGFERLQADRILTAKAEARRGPTGAALKKAINEPAMFPLATAWGSTATIHAELLPNGKVKVFYDSDTGLRGAEFTRERTSLYERYGRDAVLNGIMLEPDELVVVQFYGRGNKPVSVPAIQLVDFYQQQQDDMLGRIEAVSLLGATLGLGGVGAGGILGWADTITFALNAGSLFVNAYRDDIAKTALGRRFLEAWDVAEGIADYYNWGRLGVDGLRLIHAKVSPAFTSWRQEASTTLTAAERETIANVQQQTQEWLDAVRQAESSEAEKYLEAHPPKKVEGEPGQQHADIEGGHQVKEAPGGLGCKLYSNEGTDVLCPKEFKKTKSSKPRNETNEPSPKQRKVKGPAIKPAPSRSKAALHDQIERNLKELLKDTEHVQTALDTFAQFDKNELEYVADLGRVNLERFARLSPKVAREVAKSRITSAWALRMLADDIGPGTSEQVIQRKIAQARRHQSQTRKGFEAANPGDWNKLSGKDRSSIGRHLGLEIEQVARDFASRGWADEVIDYEKIDGDFIKKRLKTERRILITQGKLKDGALRFDIVVINFERTQFELIDLVPESDRAHVEKTKLYRKELQKLLPEFTDITQEGHYLGAKGQVVKDLGIEDVDQ